MSRCLLMTLILGIAGCAAAEDPQIEIVTNKGTIRLELYASKAPNTVQNFMQYVDDKFYDGKLFHRVIPNGLILGGGFERDKNGVQAAITRPPIKSEAMNGLKNERGTIAMARGNDPDSATSQFYINLVENKDFDPNPKLPGGNTVFGKVIDGMNVVDAISRVKTSKIGPEPSVPDDDVVIETIRRVPAK